MTTFFLSLSAGSFAILFTQFFIAFASLARRDAKSANVPYHFLYAGIGLLTASIVSGFLS